MKVIWMPEAEFDLRSVHEYIKRDNSAIAQRVVISIVDFVEEQLLTFPRSGRAGRVADTYEIMVPKLPYYIPYRIKDATIEILRVYHTSRQWPDRF